MLSRRNFLKLMALIPVGTGLHWWSGALLAAEPPVQQGQKLRKGKVTPAERKAAAKRAAEQGLQPGVAGIQAMPDPNAVPHYFGPFANYANSPVPTGAIAAIALDNGGSGYTAPTVTISDVYSTGSGATATATVAGGVITGIAVTNGGTGYSAPIVTIEDATGVDAAATPALGGPLTGGIKKFLDRVPGLGYDNRNLLGQYIPVAIPDKNTYPGSDYYEIELGQYTEKMHSDLPLTTLRGYRQTNTSDPNVSKFHYLGPLILAERDVPVRIKFTNRLDPGAGGNLFIPVDKTVMGAGMGPLDMPGMPGMKEEYTENRATLHLHGGFVPWISDGTPHQWTTPAGESTQYPKGVSVQNVPDMPDPGDGSLTFYYNNQQSARLMFYHDHAYGITRLNVYAGEAAGYLLTDQVEDDLINGTNVSGVNPGLAKVLPNVGIPLIIQDKTFVDAQKIGAQDPTWRWGGTGSGATWMPQTGDLWMPSVYMPAQNPYDASGTNAFGRWQYGPWFWPPTPIDHPPVANEYYGTDPWEPPVRPDMPSPSMGMETFMDTPVVNGTVYPYIEVDPKTYRFRILNAANDRFFNLQMYVADPAVTTSDGRTDTEVKMVPAMKTPGFPAKWPADGRAGGAPDPATAGPSWIQIGTEGGFLPAPVVVPNQPINWNANATAFNFGNVTDHSLLLGCAERADVLVDFSAYAGQTIILYNDAPAAFPALDPRYDYYTGNPDQMDTGGAPTTQPGYGPNTRTIMQIRVSNATPAAAYDVNTLKSVFAKTAAKRGVFEVSHDPIIIPQAPYNSAYDASFPAGLAAAYVQLHESSKTFTPIGAAAPVTISFEPKAIQDEMGEAYDQGYGRMSGMLGLQLPISGAGIQNFMLYPFPTPPIDVTKDCSMTQIGEAGDGTEIWKITHNGVDTHPIHWHLVNVQLINRVAWDGALLPPDANELGWKETIRVNPLEHTIIALRPKMPTQPFDVPNSVRLIDPTMPEGVTLAGPPRGFFDPAANKVTVTNHKVNYGWEYVWHCHILSHEEMDMMHPLLFAVAPKEPSNLVATITGTGSSKKVVLTWTDNSANETGFTIQRATDGAFTAGLTTFQVGPDVTMYTDAIGATTTTFYYRVRAKNVVGDTAVYTGSSGFPTKTLTSGFSNVAIPGRSSVPVAPTGLTATVTSATRVTLTWTDNADNETGFTIERSVNGGAFAALKTVAALAGTGSVTANDGTVAAGNNYTYRVIAVNGTNLSAYSNTATVTVNTMPAPTNLAATLQSGPKVRLQWNDNTTNETGFTIERSVNSGAFAALKTVAAFAGTGAVAANDGTVTAGNTYAYRVMAINGTSQSAYSNTATVSVTVPAAPSGLTATAARITGQPQDLVTLNWTDNATNETGFRIMRATNAAFTANVVTIEVPKADKTVRQDTTARYTTYYYRVRAINAIGKSAWSNTVSVTTP